MNGTGVCHVKQNNPDSEKEILHVFFHMQNLDLEKGGHETNGQLFKGNQWKVGRGKESREVMIDVHCMHMWNILNVFNLKVFKKVKKEDLRERR
jgi:hypothetical protein